MEQTVVFPDKGYAEFGRCFLESGIKKIIVVCGSSFKRLAIGKFITEFFAANNIETVFFSDFQPNPDYESVVRGVEAFKSSDCDSILAVGGGTAMDTAKAVKAILSVGTLDRVQNNDFPSAMPLPHLAIPATAGSGAEVTGTAVVTSAPSR